jgi:acyl CoA:acetate/3-ketoacid CoA transferase
MIRRDISGHYRMSPKFAQLILDNKMEAYCWPQACVAVAAQSQPAGQVGHPHRPQNVP